MATHSYTVPAGMDVTFKISMLDKNAFVYVGQDEKDPRVSVFKYDQTDPSVPPTTLHVKAYKAANASDGKPYKYSLRLNSFQRVTESDGTFKDVPFDIVLAFNMSVEGIQARAEFIVRVTQAFSLLLNSSTDGTPNPEMLSWLAQQGAQNFLRPGQV